MQDKKRYLITGPPGKALLLFALPMMIGNLFQQLYTMVDSIVVGRYVGEGALAAVGASTAFTHIFIFAATGGSIGASVTVSRAFGAGKYDDMKDSAYTMLSSFFALSVLLAVLGLAIGRPVMAALNTPADVMDDAMTYLNIYFLGLPFLFMYNALASGFNALGRSRIPLYLLIFSSVFNVILDIILVTRARMGVAGVAWATLIAQGISAVISFTLFLREMRKYPTASPIRVFSAGKLRTQAGIAIPSILQQSTVSIGLMLVQSVVNSFGAASLAGFSAAMRVEGIAIVPMSGMGNSLSPFTAQNLGAGREDRVTRGYRVGGYLITGAFALLIMLVLETQSHRLAALFIGANGSSDAFAAATGYMRFVGLFYWLIGIKMSTDGVLRGAGDMKMFTIANLANLSIRVIVARTMAPRFGLPWVWYAVPIGWLTNYIIGYTEYRSGRWKSKMTGK